MCIHVYAQNVKLIQYAHADSLDIIHIHTVNHLFYFMIAAGSNGECWGRSGAPLVTYSSQSTRHFILAGMVEADDCGSKAPYVTHTKMDGFQHWINKHLHP